MNAKSFIAAASMLVSAGAAFAAEAPEAAATAATAATTSAASGASPVATASGLKLPTLNAASRASHDAVKTEAAECVKNYRTPLALQLDQYKN